MTALRPSPLGVEALDDPRCPDAIARATLGDIARVNRLFGGRAAAVYGLERLLDAGADAKANEIRKQTLSRLEAACSDASGSSRAGPLACESVTLYQGGQYFLYKYQRYQDVRIAFAPHQAIAAFGGDPDNFNFPRWSLDFSLLRVYRNGKPARTPDHLRWRVEGPQPGEAVFVAGHPGGTGRLLTLEQIEFQRDVSVPAYLIRNSELRGRMIQWGKTGEEPLRIVQESLLSYENSLKVYRGFQRALLDGSLLRHKASQQRELRERVAADPALARQVGSAWGAGPSVAT